jgi:hypothetical protein
MWTYEQLTGRLRDANLNLIGVGYAGRDFFPVGVFVGGKNNPEKENLKDIGPLPAGIYTATALHEDDPIVGKYAIKLEPDPATRAKIISYGRQPDTFFMHGDSFTHPGQASDGCIVQAHDVRVTFWTSTDHDIQVINSETTSDAIS